MAGTGPQRIPPYGDIISAGGNTAGATQVLANTTVFLAGGNNITLSQTGNSISIIGGAGGGGGASITLGESNLGNTSGTSGVINGSVLQFLLAGGNNVTLSQSLNGSSITITVSGANQTNQSLGLYAVSNTTLSTSDTADARSLSFEGAGIVSVGASNGSIQVSAIQTNQSGNLYASSNTFGTSSGTFDARTLSLAGSGAVLVAASNSGFVISAPVQSNQQISGFAVSNTTLSTSGTLNASNLSLEGAGGVSVGVSNGSIVISGAVGSDTIGMSNLGNTSGTTGVVSGSAVEFFLAGGNNVTLSQSINGATATITISAFNQTNDTGHVYASSNTFGTSSGSFDVRTLSIAGSGAVSVAASNSGWVISAPAQTNQSGGVYASSNTFGTSSGTYDARTLSIAGSGAISVAASNSGWVISAPTQTNQQLSMFAVSNTTLSTSSTGNASALSFEGAGGVSVGISNGSVVISGAAGGGGANSLSAFAVGNTTLSTSGTVGVSSVSFEGAGGVSVGVSNGSVVISDAGVTVSQFEPWGQFGAASTSLALGQSSLYLQHFNLPNPMRVCRMDRLVSISLVNATLSASTAHTGTRSNAWTYNETFGLFTRGTGTNSTNLYSYLSGSWSVGITESLSAQTTVAATNISVGATYTMGYITNIDTNGGTTSGSFSSSVSGSSIGITVSVANPLSNAVGPGAGPLVLNHQFGSTLMTAGDYWFAVLGQSAVTTAGSSNMVAFISHFGESNLGLGLQWLGQTTSATSITLVPGNGAFSAQTAAFPSSVAINAISNNLNASLYGNFMNFSM